ncbi:MAG: class II fructose-1,6-bisphosphate aldolase [Megasphaera sp.]|jgi:fructose-bisphosphate aldolase class II|nr:class II fructose-1,6-bisphosphate aldolase [Megasphaera sp.]
MPLVTTTEMFKKAYEGKYAIGAFNVNNMEIVQGITEAAADLHSPLILQASAGARKYAKPEYLKHLVEAAVELYPEIPIALHLDHGADFETCKSCIDGGFTSVMIDGSKYDYAENIALTKKVVAYAHERGVVVEAELGKLAGIEDDVKVAAHEASYTRPEEVEDFVSRTGVDSLAIAIGTSHGAYKFTPEQCTRNADGILVPPELRFDILEEVEKRLPNFPIVLHGASSVLPKYTKVINANGGKMPDAVGIPEDQLRRAASLAVCKINIDSDLRLGMTAGIRKHFAEHPDHFDPRQYIGEGRQNIYDIVSNKIKNVLGSENKA